jgi:hypothetical protein
MENLRKGREKRMEALKQKKEQPQSEYDLSSEDDQESDSSSDDEGFVISKKKPIRKQKVSLGRSKDDVEFPSFTPKQEFDELKNMVRELALMQKKNNKVIKKQQNNKPVNKLVLLPSAQQTQSKPQNFQLRDSLAEQLAKQLGL